MKAKAPEQLRGLGIWSFGRRLSERGQERTASEEDNRTLQVEGAKALVRRCLESALQQKQGRLGRACVSLERDFLSPDPTLTFFKILGICK